MNIIDTLFVVPLGYLMRFCYEISGNYGVSILLFTVFTRLIMVPFSVKQQKSTLARVRIMPKEERIKKLYAKEPKKMQEKIQELYTLEGFNPFAGCLPSLISLPLMFLLWPIMRRPLTYILGLTSIQIKQIADALNVPNIAAGTTMKEIEIANSMVGNYDKFNFLKDTPVLNFDFFGMDMGAIPKIAFEPLTFNLLGTDFSFPLKIVFDALIIIPILVGITSFASTYLMQKLSPMKMEGATANIFMFMPLLSIWWSFSFQAGIGLSWIFSSIVMAIQSYILYLIYNPKKILEKMEAEEVAKDEARKNRMQQKKGKDDDSIDVDYENIYESEDETPKDSEDEESVLEIGDGEPVEEKKISEKTIQPRPQSIHKNYPKSSNKKRKK